MHPIIEVAKTQIGVEEHPRGSNWGIPVQYFLDSVGVEFPASWCMAFVYWCARKAESQFPGFNNPLYKTGGVILQLQKSAALVVTTPEPGDIFIMDFGHGLGHTGIVEIVNDNMLSTIEGNTNDTGAREGYEVCRRSRNAHNIKAFIRLPYNTIKS